MPGHVLHAELNAVRVLVSHGLAELGAAGESGHVWIRTACARLTAVDAVLVEAAGVAPAPVRAVVLSVLAFGAVLLPAVAARAAGAGSAGTLVVVALALVALAGVLPAAGGRARRAVGRRRLARLPLPPVPGHPPHLGDPDLIIVPETLLHARVRLVSATLRHAGLSRWTVPQLRLAARTDPVTRRLAAADLLLCQAVDCLERYLDDLRKR